MEAFVHREAAGSGPAAKYCRALGGAGLALLLVLSAASGVVLAQGKAAGNLRIAKDASGEPVDQVEGGPGEKVFHLPKGVSSFFIAFDCSGEETDVQVRVMGAAGTVLMQETTACEQAGPKSIQFDNKGLALQDNEYVVNIYVSKSLYLADSLQLAVGDAPIAAPVPSTSPSQGLENQPTAVLTANDAANAPNSGVSAGLVQGPPGGTLLLGGIALMALVAIVLWAGWSAMKKA